MYLTYKLINCFELKRLKNDNKATYHYQSIIQPRVGGGEEGSKSVIKTVYLTYQLINCFEWKRPKNDKKATYHYQSIIQPRVGGGGEGVTEKQN